MIMAVVCAKAQDIQLATLQHGNDMQAFYGADALKAAVEAAQPNDVISLSGGTFNAPTIDKALTIQGAGYVSNVKKNRYVTSINGDMSINIPDGQRNMLIEDIYTKSNIKILGSCESMSFIRCQVMQSLEVECESHNILFLHCRISNLKLTGIAFSAYIKNCILRHLYGSSNSSEYCLVEHSTMFGFTDTVINYTFKNCAFWGPQMSTSTTNSYYNNVYNEVYIPTGCIQEENTRLYMSHYDFIKKLFNQTDDTVNGAFKLSDEGKQYKTTDDTELSVYGGDIPFTDVPSIPQITQKSVAAQSDANGKLAVKIVVEAQK